LATTIARELGSQVGAYVVDRYPDGDVAVQFLDSVRRKEVFLVQPTSPPVNDHLVELLALADACRRSGASRVSAIVPFFGYGRADKRNGKREPIMARVVADLLQVVGIRHIVTVDLHSLQIEGFFHAPVDNLHCRANSLPRCARSPPIISACRRTSGAWGWQQVTRSSA
jgi:ribose-phosphate pyrophosphokinase